jgi:hypothetical protein
MRASRQRERLPRAERLALGGTVSAAPGRDVFRRVLRGRTLAGLYAAAAALVLLGLAATLAPVWGQGTVGRVCGPRPHVAAVLLEDWGERPALEGLTMAGHRAELFVSPGGRRTWTFAVTDSAGTTCVLETGVGVGPAPAGRPPGRRAGEPR